jgi:hypothetical protein
LSRRPEFADRCDWSKLKPLAWRQLLLRQPQFADKCDKWDEYDVSAAIANGIKESAGDTPQKSLKNG